MVGPKKEDVKSPKEYIGKHVTDYIRRRVYEDKFSDRKFGEKSPMPFLTHFSLGFATYTRGDLLNSDKGFAECEAENLFNNKYLGYKLKIWEKQSFVDNFIDCLKFLAAKSKNRKIFFLSDIVNIMLDKQNFSYMNILSPVYSLVAFAIPAAVTIITSIPLWSVMVPIVISKLIYNSYNSSKTILEAAQGDFKKKYIKNLGYEEELVLEKIKKKDNEIEASIDNLISLVAGKENIIFNFKAMLRGGSKNLILDGEGKKLAGEAKKLLEEVSKLLRPLETDKEIGGVHQISEISRAFMKKLHLMSDMPMSELKEKNFTAEEKKPLTAQEAKEFLGNFSKGLEEVKKSVEQQRAKSKDTEPQLTGETKDATDKATDVTLLPSSPEQAGIVNKKTTSLNQSHHQ